MTIVAGVDFGTESVRVSILHSEKGRLGFGTGAYPVLRRRDDADFATQRHEDHCRALETAFAAALSAAKIKGAEIKALAVDTTGSTVVAVDEESPSARRLLSLVRSPRLARSRRDHRQRRGSASCAALDWSGGTYSSEWGFAKLLHWLRHHPEKRSAFATALEHCDLMVATLCGITGSLRIPRSICAMGHKWMWNESLGGLPSDAFLTSVDPLFAGVRQHLAGNYRTSATPSPAALSEEWAARLGLKPGIPIPVGALDAHWDAIGAGCQLGDVVNVIGTSTCIMALSESERADPRRLGHRARLDPSRPSWGSKRAWPRWEACSTPSPGGPTARSPTSPTRSRNTAPARPDCCVSPGTMATARCWPIPRLRGITLGWRLNHTAADEFFAAIEGTAFHTRIILERMEEYGAPIERVIHGGGIPQRNDVLNRVYADVLGKPILVPAKDTTSLGSGVFAFLAAGAFTSVEEAQEALSPGYRIIEPTAAGIATYTELFARFRELYFSLARMEQAH